MENIVRKSLDPSITRSEDKEYKRYTQQFKNIEKLTVSHGDQTSYTNIENFPEFQQYQNFINKNALDAHPSALKTSSLDEQLYNTYVEIPRRAASLQTSREVSGNAKKRYDGYANYLRNGKYLPSQHTYKQATSMTASAISSGIAAIAGFKDT
ncbi:hypothetical protein BDB01DRAFT_112031 [Pilobolus umbonatus]|nr:hypothetical protein BDB01DRAFT_112031 [Pilobolus umbonatus]